MIRHLIGILDICVVILRAALGRVELVVQVHRLRKMDLRAVRCRRLVDVDLEILLRIREVDSRRAVVLLLDIAAPAFFDIARREREPLDLALLLRLIEIDRIGDRVVGRLDGSRLPSRIFERLLEMLIGDGLIRLIPLDVLVRREGRPVIEAVLRLHEGLAVRRAGLERLTVRKTSERGIDDRCLRCRVVVFFRVVRGEAELPRQDTPLPRACERRARERRALRGDELELVVCGARPVEGRRVENVLRPHRAVRVPGDIFCVVHSRDLAELRVASEQAPERDAVRHIRVIRQSRLAVIRLFLDDIRDAGERRRHRLLRDGALRLAQQVIAGKYAAVPQHLAEIVVFAHRVGELEPIRHTMIPGILAVVRRAAIDGIVLPVGERPPLDADALRAAGRVIAVLQEVRGRLALRVAGLVVNVIRRVARMVVGDVRIPVVDFRDGVKERCDVSFRDLRRGDLTLAAHGLFRFARQVGEIQHIVAGIVVREGDACIFDIVRVRHIGRRVGCPRIGDANPIFIRILFRAVSERDGRQTFVILCPNQRGISVIDFLHRRERRRQVARRDGTASRAARLRQAIVFPRVAGELVRIAHESRAVRVVARPVDIRVLVLRRGVVLDVVRRVDAQEIDECIAGELRAACANDVRRPVEDLRKVLPPDDRRDVLRRDDAARRIGGLDLPVFEQASVKGIVSIAVLPRDIKVVGDALFFAVMAVLFVEARIRYRVAEALRALGKGELARRARDVRFERPHIGTCRDVLAFLLVRDSVAAVVYLRDFRVLHGMERDALDRERRDRTLAVGEVVPVRVLRQREVIVPPRVREGNRVARVRRVDMRRLLVGAVRILHDVLAGRACLEDIGVVLAAHDPRRAFQRGRGVVRCAVIRLADIVERHRRDLRGVDDALADEVHRRILAAAVQKDIVRRRAAVPVRHLRGEGDILRRRLAAC